jgi:hypothetical protein
LLVILSMSCPSISARLPIRRFDQELRFFHFHQDVRQPLELIVRQGALKNLLQP